MHRELNLLAKYPRVQRDPAARAAEKTEQDVATACLFGKEFFDGERRHGYGGYSHDIGRWKGVVADMMAHYDDPISVLDVGCAKGNFLRAYELMHGGGCVVAGLDVSRYAIENALPMMKPCVQWGDARRLPWADKSFDLVVSINTLHNLPEVGVLIALSEIERVGKDAYITVDAYSTEEERQRVFDWNLTAQTILHVDGWKKLFKEAGYNGDFGWWVP